MYTTQLITLKVEVKPFIEPIFERVAVTIIHYLVLEQNPIIVLGKFF